MLQEGYIGADQNWEYLNRFIQPVSCLPKRSCIGADERKSESHRVRVSLCCRTLAIGSEEAPSNSRVLAVAGDGCLEWLHGGSWLHFEARGRWHDGAVWYAAGSATRRPTLRPPPSLAPGPLSTLPTPPISTGLATGGVHPLVAFYDCVACRAALRTLEPVACVRRFRRCLRARRRPGTIWHEDRPSMDACVSRLLSPSLNREGAGEKGTGTPPAHCTLAYVVMV